MSLISNKRNPLTLACLYESSVTVWKDAVTYFWLTNFNATPIIFIYIYMTTSSLKYTYHWSIKTSSANIVVFQDLTYISFPFYGVCRKKQSALVVYRRRRHGDLQRGSAQQRATTWTSILPETRSHSHRRLLSISSHQVSFTSLCVVEPILFFSFCPVFIQSMILPNVHTQCFGSAFDRRYGCFSEFVLTGCCCCCFFHTSSSCLMDISPS